MVALPSSPRKIELQELELLSFTMNSPLNRLPLRSMRDTKCISSFWGHSSWRWPYKTISHWSSIHLVFSSGISSDLLRICRLPSQIQECALTRSFFHSTGNKLLIFVVMHVHTIWLLWLEEAGFWGFNALQQVQPWRASTWITPSRPRDKNSAETIVALQLLRSSWLGLDRPGIDL